MPNSSSFDKDLYAQLKIIIVIHKDLLGLTNETIEEIAAKILNQPKIVGTKEGIYTLCRCIIDIVSFYSKNIEQITELFIYLLNNKSTDKENFLHLLPKYIVRCIHTREKLKMSALYFLRQLLLRNAISYNSIVNEFNSLPPHFEEKNAKIKLDDNDPNPTVNNEELPFEENENYQGELIDLLTPYTQANNKKYQILMMFYPEINQRTKININQILNVHKKNTSVFQYPFEPDTFHSNLNEGYNSDYIADVIRRDDIELFQAYISQSPDQKFKDQRIKNKTNYFERFSILSHEPTLIEYSAFFNSVKIFKYLLLNKANTIDFDDEYFSLVDYAVAGGSHEIIHILQQNHFDLVCGIPTSIRNYQNETFAYLLDNFFPKTDDDFDLMDRGNFRKKERAAILSGFEKNGYPNFLFKLDSENEYDYFFNNDPFNFEYEYNENEKSDNRFQYFNFDIVFRAIVESNNWLALFTLFDYGMKINAFDRNSKKTLLHWAVQKGKMFLFRLLLSNKFIDPSMVDINGESPIVYSLKYGKIDFFFEFMKNEKVKSSLKTHDYLLLANYAEKNGFQNANDYLFKNFKFDLIDLIKSNDIETFCEIVNYAPIFYLFDQIKPVLLETFESDKLVLFAVVANRMALEESLKFKGEFYYVSDDENPTNYWRILQSYCYGSSERYNFKNRYQGSHNPFDDDDDVPRVFDRVNSCFQFKKIDKKQKLVSQVQFSHPLYNRYKSISKE